MRTLFAILGAIMIALAGCVPLAQQANEPVTRDVRVIKLGALLPLSGEAAEYGKEIQAAQMIALDEINQRWAENGMRMEIVFEDAKCDASAAASAMQKLVDTDGVKVVLGGACSSETLAAAPIAEDNHVILLSPASPSPAVTNAGDFVFRTYPSDGFSAYVAAKIAKDMFGAGKAAIISENKHATQALREVFKKSFDGDIVADAVFDPDDADLRIMLLKLKKKQPDMIYIVPQTVAAGVALMKQMRDVQLENRPWLSTGIFLSKDALAEHAGVLEGLIGIEPAFDESNEKAQALFAKYRAAHGREPSLPFFMASGYDDVHLIDEAIEANNGKIDAAQIRDFLYDVRGWDGALGALTFDGNGDPLLHFVAKQIKHGHIVPIMSRKEELAGKEVSNLNQRLADALANDTGSQGIEEGTPEDGLKAENLSAIQIPRH